MSRIVYGVMGDSRGHVSRAMAVAQEMPQHDYLFVGGGTVSHLERQGHRVCHMPVMGTEIENGRVSVLGTLLAAVRLLPRFLPVIDRLAGIIEEFRPDLILTDYEFFTQMAACSLKRPCISVDNQHFLTHCRYGPPPGKRMSRFMTLLVIRSLYSAASHYLVSSFYAAPPKDGKRTQVLPPVIRRVVRSVSPSLGEHGMIYLRGGVPAQLLEALTRLRRRFMIYGMGERPPEQNLTFKAFSDREFLKDLASCRYVLCNGGHSTISEALHYGKPVFCIPVALFYEQTVNAHLLSVAGYGDWCVARPDWERSISRFEKRLDEYAARIREGDFWGNERVAACLQDLMGKMGRPHRTIP